MARIKPGTPHPNRKGLVMGKNGRYVAKSTYNRQVKASKTKPVKTNPTSAPRGAQGPRTAPVQGPSRRTPSTMGGDTGRRGGVNRYGTKGTPRSGPPGLGKPPRFNPSIRTPGRTPGGAAGLAIATGAALGEAYRRTDRAKAESARGEGRRTFSSQKPPQNLLVSLLKPNQNLASKDVTPKVVKAVAELQLLASPNKRQSLSAR